MAKKKRMGVVTFIGENVVDLVGYGTYEGYQPIPESINKNLAGGVAPAVMLDDINELVFGVEAQIYPEKYLKSVVEAVDNVREVGLSFRK